MQPQSDEDTKPNPKIFLEESSKNVYSINKIESENRINRINRFDDRRNNTFHASFSLVTAYRKYAKMSGLSLADCVERALLKDMECYPLENHTVTIQHMLKESLDNGIQHDLEDQILCSDIEGYLETLERIKRSGQGDFEEFKLGLYKVVVNAIKFRSPSDRLLSLLHKVKEDGYFE